MPPAPPAWPAPCGEDVDDGGRHSVSVLVHNDYYDDGDDVKDGDEDGGGDGNGDDGNGDDDDGGHIVLPPRRQVSITTQGVRQVAAAEANTK